MLREFFGDRYLGRDLNEALARMMRIQQVTGREVTWLTVSNNVAHDINRRILSRIHEAQEPELSAGFETSVCDG